MRTDLVVLRWKEDLSWLSSIDNSKYNLILYNTGHDDIDIDFIPLENIGRESRAYLEYIVSNYNNLSEYIVFLQANPFEHIHRIGNGQPEDMYDFLNNHNFDFDFFGMGYLAVDDEQIEQRVKILEYLEKKYKQTFDKKHYFIAGAQFVVKRDLILKRPLEMWKELLLFHKDSVEIFDNVFVNNEKMPWIVERFWNSIL